jgi:hypothetical protein
MSWFPQILIHYPGISARTLLIENHYIFPGNFHVVIWNFACGIMTLGRWNRDLRAWGTLTLGLQASGEDDELQMNSPGGQNPEMEPGVWNDDQDTSVFD